MKRRELIRVRNGSNSEVAWSIRHVCFDPNSGSLSLATVFASGAVGKSSASVPPRDPGEAFSLRPY